MIKEPKVLQRMRLSCCWRDNLSEKELNEVVDYINYLQRENKLLKDRIFDLKNYTESGDFKSNFKSVSNEFYIRAKIKKIIGLTMSNEEFEILKGEENE